MSIRSLFVNSAAFKICLSLCRDNDFGIEAGVGIAELLSCSSTLPLSCLDASINPLLGGIGVACIAQGLRDNVGLRELKLEGVRMDGEGARALAAALSDGARGMRR